MNKEQKRKIRRNSTKFRQHGGQVERAEHIIGICTEIDAVALRVDDLDVRRDINRLMRDMSKTIEMSSRPTNNMAPVVVWHRDVVPGVYVVEWHSIDQDPRDPPAPLICFELHEFASLICSAASTIYKRTASGETYFKPRKTVDPRVPLQYAYSSPTTITHYKKSDESIQKLSDLGFADRLDEIHDAWLPDYKRK